MKAREDYLQFVYQLVSREKKLLSTDGIMRLADQAAENVLPETGSAELRLELLTNEVDRLLLNRLNLPSYRTWLEMRREGEPNV